MQPTVEERKLCRNIHHAAARCDWDKVRGLLRSSPSPTMPGLSITRPRGYTALHVSCMRGAPLDVVDALIDANSDAASLRCGHSHDTPLHKACQHGASEEVILLLLRRQPGAASLLDIAHQSPLNAACRCNRSMPVIRGLVEADPSQVARPDKPTGLSPLLHFLRANHLDMLDFLRAEDRRPSPSLSSTSSHGAPDQAIVVPPCEMYDKAALLFEAYAKIMRLPFSHKHQWGNVAFRIEGCPVQWLEFYLKYRPKNCQEPDDKENTLLHALAASSWRKDFSCDSDIRRYYSCSLCDEKDTTKRSLVAFFERGFSKVLCRQCYRDRGGGLNEASPCRVDSKVDVEHRLERGVSILLRTEPNLASLVNKAGRLPFTVAILSYWKSDCVVRAMLKEEPRATATRDPTTGLFPFMLAAVGNKESKGDKFDQIGFVFELLMRSPTLVGSV